MDIRFFWVFELTVSVVFGAVYCVRLEVLIEGVVRELKVTKT